MIKLIEKKILSVENRKKLVLYIVKPLKFLTLNS